MSGRLVAFFTVHRYYCATTTGGECNCEPRPLTVNISDAPMDNGPYHALRRCVAMADYAAKCAGESFAEHDRAQAQ